MLLILGDDVSVCFTLFTCEVVTLSENTRLNPIFSFILSVNDRPAIPKKAIIPINNSTKATLTVDVSCAVNPEKIFLFLFCINTFLVKYSAKLIYKKALVKYLRQKNAKNCAVAEQWSRPRWGSRIYEIHAYGEESKLQGADGNDQHTVGAAVGIIAHGSQHHHERRGFHLGGVNLVL